MRFILTPLLVLSLLFAGCSEADEPDVPVVETLEVKNSSSSSRMFQGLLEHISETDTIISYGFEWENRYGSWQAKKHGQIKKGSFYIKDLQPLSKWSSFTVRAFVETRNGVIYGDVEEFITEGK